MLQELDTFPLFLHIVTFAWLTWWAVRTVRQIARGVRSSVLVVLLVFYIFFGIPLLLDALIGRPTYNIFPGIEPAAGDLNTIVMYCLYTAIVPPILWRFGRSRKRNQHSGQQDAMFLAQPPKWLNALLWIFVVSPILFLLNAPNPQVYLLYGAVSILRESFSPEAIEFHALLSATCLLSILAAAGVLLLRPGLTWSSILFLAPFVLSASWLYGKRTIVALLLFVFGFVLWQKGLIKSWRLITGLVISATLLLGYSYFYQTQIRKESAERRNTFAERWELFRIDYGRDSITKLTIFAELYPERSQILEYRGQSILFYATMFVPRAKWPDKPWPYAVYATTASLNSATPRPWGWAITTSWMEEAIANFGWLGMLLAPFSLAIFCRIGDSKNNVVLRLLTTLTAVLLLVLQLPAVAPIVLLWVITYNLAGNRKRRFKNFRHRAMPPSAVLGTRID